RRRVFLDRHVAGREGGRASRAVDRSLSRDAVIRDAASLLSELRAIHAAIRDAVVEACEETALELLAAPAAEEGGDTIFAIDRISETVLLSKFERLSQSRSFVLIAE